MTQPKISRTALQGGQVRMAANWERVLIAQMEPDFGRAADTMKDVAESLVPVDTGDLKASIDSRVFISGLDLVAIAEATEPYADFVEYGTGKAGPPSVNRGAGRVKQPPGYVHGGSPGMRAQPFLRPAMVAALKRHFAFGRS